MLNVVRTLDRSRYEPLVVFLTGGPFVEEVSRLGIATRVIEAGRVRNLLRARRAVRDLKRLIDAEGVGLVHSHDHKAHVYGGLAANLAGIPTLLHLQGVPRPSLSRDGLVSVLSVLVPASQTIACSRYVADAFLAAWPMRRRAKVVHSGVLPPATGGAHDIRPDFGIAHDAPLIVLPARLQRWKGVHVFVEAAAIVNRVRPDARFMIVGGTLFGLEPEYADELRRQADALGLTDTLLFTGFRSDVSQFFAAADIVVHCSVHPDPFPTVLLEAMAWGKPVVASDSGGPREIVSNAETGLLVSPGRPDLLAQAVLRLIAEPGLRNRMGEAGKNRVESEFHAARMTSQIQLLYDELAGSRNRVGETSSGQ